MSGRMSESELDRIAEQLLQRCTSNVTQQSDYMTKLMTAETDLIRFNIVYEDLKKYNLFPKLIQDNKDNALANTFRIAGNQLFRKEKYLLALEEYTRSIATAETPEVLALAYANRAACLLHLKRHSDCIVDIDRALANNYPEKLKEKVDKRREQAEKSQKPQEKYHEEVPKIPESQKSPLIQCASNCIKIKCNQQYGRHVVATRDIEIGELIAVEKPFAWVIKAKRLIHCHHCLELCYNTIPCSSCTITLFCSEACKDQAQIYHKYECLIRLHLFKEKIEYLELVVRVALLAKQEYELLKTYSFDKNEYYRSDRYKEIHCLKREPLPTTNAHSYLFAKNIIAATVFHWLESTDFFENDNIKDHFNEIVTSQIQIYLINCIKVTEYSRDGENNERLSFSGFANALCSFGSLFNHSCCPNTFRCFYGSTVAFRTVNTIKKGEQCFITYGPTYSDGGTKDERQFILSKKYRFTCKCKACERNWEGRPVTYAETMNLSGSTLKMHLDKLSEIDLEFAKQMLPVFIERLKRWEHTEPLGHALTLKKYLKHCYKAMGNTTRI